MLKVENTLLLVIDVQEKLFMVMPDKESLLKNLQNLVRGCGLLTVPVIITEQNPAGLGPTLSEITSLIPEGIKVEKFGFSCCAESTFNKALKSTNRHQILICGIESHICVYQTAMELLTEGYEVHIVTDCIASRSPENRELAQKRLLAEGAKLTGVEMALFELLQTSKAAQFKAISALIK